MFANQVQLTPIGQTWMSFSHQETMILLLDIRIQNLMEYMEFLPMHTFQHKEALYSHIMEMLTLIRTRNGVTEAQAVGTVRHYFVI